MRGRKLHRYDHRIDLRRRFESRRWSEGAIAPGGFRFRGQVAEPELSGKKLHPHTAGCAAVELTFFGGFGASSQISPRRLLLGLKSQRTNHYGPKGLPPV